LLEVVLSLAAIALLLGILMPALAAARLNTYKSVCAANQRMIGQGWLSYMRDHDDRLPVIYQDAAWNYGGVRFNRVNHWPFLDFDRPINRYLPVNLVDGTGELLFRCPADTGIALPGQARAEQRTVYETVGTSYRANAQLLRVAGTEAGSPPQGRLRGEAAANPAEAVLMGAPVWFEALHHTGRDANWFGRPDPDKLLSGSTSAGQGNMLFLDGSVRFLIVDPDSRRVCSMFNPRAPRNDGGNASDGAAAASPGPHSGSAR
jgi:prepilin-type processing-associated H-X9-DG protein